MSAWNHITPEALIACRQYERQHMTLEDFLADVLPAEPTVERIPLSRTDKATLAVAGLSMLGAIVALLWPR